ncbi:hypothetical protein [Patiriisocius marinus]|uniref:hypothetical protein n=1 Tax=Patiriisocius marinus TaxID=1397112 RepID=UPI00232D03DB|nr:hypothetical protein [Patiriisocius marinus]
MFKNLLIFSAFFSIYSTNAQIQNCNLKKSINNEISIVDKDDILCLAKNADSEKIILFSFGTWCSPCRLHLKNALMLQKKYDVTVYILLIDRNEEKSLRATFEYLRNREKDVTILLLSPEYSKRPNKKYRKFLAEITPNNFENINDMSKYILLNKEGDVEMVTNWKDNSNFDWEDDINMLKKKIIPLLSVN